MRKSQFGIGNRERLRRNVAKVAQLITAGQGAPPKIEVPESLKWPNRPRRPLVMWRTPMAGELPPAFFSLTMALRFHPEMWADPQTMPEGMWEWFEGMMRDFNGSVGDVMEAIVMFLEITDKGEWPPSREEVQIWLLELMTRLCDLHSRFVLQGAALVSDAQVNEKRRQRGREDMRRLNQEKTIPKELKALWQERAEELKSKHGANPWRIAGWLSTDKNLNPQGRWTQKAIYNHIRSIFPSSRIS